MTTYKYENHPLVKHINELKAIRKDIIELRKCIEKKFTIPSDFEAKDVLLHKIQKKVDEKKSSLYTESKDLIDSIDQLLEDWSTKVADTVCLSSVTAGNSTELTEKLENLSEKSNAIICQANATIKEAGLNNTNNTGTKSANTGTKSANTGVMNAKSTSMNNNKDCDDDSSLSYEYESDSESSEERIENRLKSIYGSKTRIFTIQLGTRYELSDDNYNTWDIFVLPKIPADSQKKSGITISNRRNSSIIAVIVQKDDLLTTLVLTRGCEHIIKHDGKKSGNGWYIARSAKI